MIVAVHIRSSTGFNYSSDNDSCTRGSCTTVSISCGRSTKNNIRKCLLVLVLSIVTVVMIITVISTAPIGNS